MNTNENEKTVNSVFDIIGKSVALVSIRTRRLIIFSAISLSALRVIDIIGLGLIFPIIGILSDKRDSITQFAGKDITTLLSQFSNNEIALYLAVGLFSLIVLKGVLSIGATYWFGKAFFADEAQCTGRLYQDYLNASIKFHGNHNAAELLRNLKNTMPSWYGQVIRPLGGVVADIFLAFSIAILLLFANPLAGIVGLGILITGAAGYWIVASGPVRFIAIEAHSVATAYNKTLLESLGSITDIKTLNSYSFFSDRFNSAVSRIVRAAYLYQVFQQIPQNILEITATAAILGFIIIATAGLVEGDMISFIALFVASIVRLMPTSQRLVVTLNQMRGAGAAFEQVMKDVETFGPWFINGNRSKLLGPTASTIDQSSDSFFDGIELKNICYNYDGAPGVTNINLKISKGSSIGIIGPSGAGKSTLARILLGLIEPQSGQFILNGQPRPGQESAIHRSIGYVPQDIHLLDDTLCRNIAFGLRDDEIDQDRVKMTISQSQLEEFVKALPNGWNTYVGERGVRLSGGQRQRIAIARALYHNPNTLILDEATSALDVETERKISTTLDCLNQEKTLIIIAHRLSTVQNCTQLVFLKEGKILAKDTYDELQKTCPDFRQWVTYITPTLKVNS